MTLEKLLIHTQAWAQEEIAVQGVLFGILARQEEYIRVGNTTAVGACGEELEALLADRPARDRRRAALLEAFGRLFGVPAETLTLASILTRAGEAGADISKLAALREELHQRVTAVGAASRKIAALARYHQGLMDDVVLALAGDDGSGPRPAGVLLDTEA